MTIDWARVLRGAGAVAMTLVAWFGGMGALALVVEPGEVVAFGRMPDLIRATTDADALLVRAGPGFVTLSGQHGGWVRKLYSGGAWFVWPIVGRGCGGSAL